MAIVTLSYAQDKNKTIAKNFVAGEFASKSGDKLYSDVILYDTVTLGYLGAIRDRLDALGYACTATNITSGYRTPEHDRAVRGNGGGPHVRGEAADFTVRCTAGAYTVTVGTVHYVRSDFLCCVAQDLGIMGIERILGDKAVHIDSRTTKWWARQAGSLAQGYSYPTIGDFFAYYGIPREAVRVQEEATSAPQTADSQIQPGDLVTILPGATYYGRQTIPAWVKAQEWYVESVKGDRAVIDRNQRGDNRICSAIHVSHLNKAGG